MDTQNVSSGCFFFDFSQVRRMGENYSRNIEGTCNYLKNITYIKSK